MAETTAPQPPAPVDAEVVDEPQALVPTQGAEPPAVPQAAGTPAHFLEMALAKGADVTELGPLMDLYERWEKGQARKAFHEAMTRFQSIVPPIVKDRDVSHDRGRTTVYRFATMPNIVRTVKASLAECDLSYRFEQEDVEGGIKVTCVATHVAGHSESSSMSGPADTSGAKNAIQARGSSDSYLCRYTFRNVFGLVIDEDDDGRSAAPNPLDDAELPQATDQTDEAASTRGPYGGWIREVRDERAEGNMTRRECLVEGWPDNHVLITKSKFEKYKADGPNEWKNAGMGRPFTCDVTDGKNVKGEVWFLAETLRHPAATGAIDVPGFAWERQQTPEDIGTGEGTPSKADFYRTRIGAQMRRLTAEQREKVPANYHSEQDEGVLKALLDQVLTWVGENQDES